MAERMIRTQSYVVVCVVLVLLTFLTVGFSFAPASPRTHVLVGLSIALCKASLVLLFFMHLIISTRLTWSVVLVAGFWLLILVVLTSVDYLSRESIPGMFGH